jgi:hypothetical protein
MKMGPWVFAVCANLLFSLNCMFSKSLWGALDEGGLKISAYEWLWHFSGKPY